MRTIRDLTLVAVLLLASSCTLITEVDRNLAHHPAPDGAAGSAGSMSGSGTGGSAGATGSGGSAGKDSGGATPADAEVDHKEAAAGESGTDAAAGGSGGTGGVSSGGSGGVSDAGHSEVDSARPDSATDAQNTPDAAADASGD